MNAHSLRAKCLRPLAVCLIAGGATIGGCVALAAGAALGIGTYAYVEGDMTVREDSSLDATWDASKATMNELGYAITDESKDSMEASLKAKKADDTPVRLSLKAEDEGVTKLTVRVGTFGDETESRLILDKIRGRL